jgi:cytochrome oxidase assembly protein ShyY1
VLRVLLRPRWLGFAALVAVLVVAFVNLGLWQFHRYDARHSRNQRIAAGQRVAPVPVEQLMRVGAPIPVADEYRSASATGRYDTAREFLVAGRTVNGHNGYVVLTPLVTEAGPVLLVARGWVPPSDAGAGTEPAVPTAPAGEVTMTGRIRFSESGSLREAPLGSRTQVRAIDVTAIGGRLGGSVLPGYVELTDQRPTADRGLTLLPLPELDDGPHLSYGVQWFLFAAFAIGAYLYFGYREANGPPAGGPTAGATISPRSG